MIVGAGSAGSVLAEQLSADPACRVTVLEAGAFGSGIETMIRDAGHLPIGPGSPVVQHCRTLLTQDPPRCASFVRGSILGGSGASDGGYFCRALTAGCDAAARPGWERSAVEPHYGATTIDLDAEVPGDRVGIPIRRSTELAVPSRAFVDAALGAGFRWLPDLNAEPTDANEPPGVGAVPLNIVDGVRINPGEVFLGAAAGRSNLEVRRRTRAVRIRMDGLRAVGIDAIGPAGPIRLRADCIVLSAGAIETAHLLMVSGIGPAASLGAPGIEPLVDLPVGQSCWDHPEWVIPTADAARRDSDTRPVLEVVLMAGRLEIRPYTKGFRAMARAGDSSEPDPVHIGVALMHPRSRARISLDSNDPAAAPKVEHRYDTNPEDVAELRRGHQLVAEVMGSKVVQGKPEWSTSQHLCGSAPMGSDSDELAVVDPRFRVRGVDGLWVVDGSVLPRPLSRGPHATIVMLGHRAAGFVHPPGSP